MRLLPSDPDIQTIISRIKNGDYDLQPDFQRGEVWGDPKKKRLIDSILRDWHVPPIHVVEVKETAQQEVLDGQQRLAAIRDFVEGKIRVDGNTQPEDAEIKKLNGLHYNALPEFWRRRFDQFTVRVFKITDYSPEEPGELFYRLNQPTNLTAAEQRNAFFGPARQQIKELAESMQELGLNQEALGFSNSRMAYDDVISKVCYSLDKETLLEKVTSFNITSKYRAQESFSDESIQRARRAINTLSNCNEYFNYKVKFNKATLFSWLCFLASLERDEGKVDIKLTGDFISRFEWLRNSNKNIKVLDLEGYENIKLTTFEEHLLNLFNDRASSRAANVSSVLTRDLVIWIFYYNYIKFNSTLNLKRSEILDLIIPHSDWAGSEVDTKVIIETFISETNWGAVL
ncbi:DUF262 domain-containing protein [Bacillus inaquosorum]|uniref:DUF262 domain-containing protein n=1 Tax=Bacillus inaquosorum TaxID=483913 RepID=UPI002281F26F|nr:DUF262 domain-containing protein [Bacillus inaquosorum]MCY7977715.1 DUF262 domain-containing protein [Bacillus inaquosorum]MEC0591321.1 DUF262 domain-containing protein [Bacillus inaquosorum]